MVVRKLQVDISAILQNPKIKKAQGFLCFLFVYCVVVLYILYIIYLKNRGKYDKMILYRLNLREGEV